MLQRCKKILHISPRLCAVKKALAVAAQISENSMALFLGPIKNGESGTVEQLQTVYGDKTGRLQQQFSVLFSDKKPAQYEKQKLKKTIKGHTTVHLH